MLKKYFQFIMLLAFSTANAQLTELYEIQDFSPEVLSKNHIRIITGYEYTAAKKNAHIVLKTKQSFRLFDRDGHLIKKEFFWEYSDIGNLIKEYTYDSIGRLQTMKQFFGDSLELSESYTYDDDDRLISWKVNFTKGGSDFDFVKQIEYDEFENPIAYRIELKQGTRVDSLKNFYNENNELILTLKTSTDKSVSDSIVYERGMTDTIYRKYYYENGALIYKQSKIKKDGKVIYRTTNYKKGKLETINYHKYEENGNIVENRTFHHYAQGNFQKKFYYNEKSLPTEKIVFKNKKEPENTVKFEYGYY